ncbi:hypothetical protein CSPAE12_04050 [Colletotrichum incanum]|nr:hypothetical protein CSPAE12_04050 [Colletotrichum incanum]
MRFFSILSAASVAAAIPTIATSDPPEVEITNVHAKTLANYTLVFEFDVVDNKDGQLAHCTGEWDEVNRFLSTTPCSIPSYNATIFFPNSVSGIQYWAAFVGIQDHANRYLAMVQTGTPSYTCGHSGTQGVLSACFTETDFKIATVAI